MEWAPGTGSGFAGHADYVRVGDAPLYSTRGAKLHRKGNSHQRNDLQKKSAAGTGRLSQIDTSQTGLVVSFRYVRPFRARKLLVLPSLASIEISHPRYLARSSSTVTMALPPSIVSTR